MGAENRSIYNRRDPMNKNILWTLVWMAVTAWGHSEETKSTAVQPTVATTPAAVMTAQPAAAAQRMETATPAPATAGAQASAGPWFLSVAGGIDVPAQNWIPAYSLGGGGQVAAGYRLSEEWAVELDLDDFYFSGSGITTGAVSDYESRVLPTARYSFRTGSDIRPYVLAGLGIDLQFLSGPAGGALATSFAMAAGLGVEWEMDPRMFLFAEGKWDLLAADGPNHTTVTGQDMPALAGVRWGL